MKTILASVYSLNPYKGSEEGMGWNYVFQAARYQRVIAVTRVNNRQAVEQYMEQHPNPVYANMQFLYFDLPYWMRFWKRKGQGVILYYLLWQWFLPRFVKRAQVQYDIVHNINFHNDWSPSFLWKLNKPFVWGPIGHHPRIPKQYLQGYGVVVAVKEQITWAVKWLFWNAVPALKRTVKEADYIWCMNHAVPQVLNLSDKEVFIGPSVATHDFGWLPQKQEKKFVLISAGRLVPLKGFDLTIRAFGKFITSLPYQQRCQCVLHIVGSGEEEARYKQLAKEAGAEMHIVFTKWIARDELMDMMKTASAFVFPSHEGAGMVIPEALSFGLPVLCLNNEGPGAFIDATCGIAVEGGSTAQATSDLANAMYNIYSNASLRRTLSKGARAKFEKTFNWEVRGEQLKNIYHQVLSKP